MEHEMAEVSGWMIRGIHAIVALGAWAAVALVYGILRSLGEARQDTIRPPGPLD